MEHQDTITLYHGSNVVVKQPEVRVVGYTLACLTFKKYYEL